MLRSLSARVAAPWPERLLGLAPHLRLSPGTPPGACTSWVPGPFGRGPGHAASAAGVSQGGEHLSGLRDAARNYGDGCRSPGPPLGRLAHRRCRLALTPGRPSQNGAPTPCRETAQGVPRRGGLAGTRRARRVWRGVSGRPGGPGVIRAVNMSSSIRY
jgi:hypothetical protein